MFGLFCNRDKMLDVMHVDIPEGKTPWYKRLWKFIRRIIKRYSDYD